MRKTFLRFGAASAGLALVVVAGAAAFGTAGQRGDVSAADHVASTYRASLDDRLDALDRQVLADAGGRADSFADLGRRMTDRVEAVPALPTRGTTAYGREHSKAYTSVAARRQLLLMPYASLVSTVLRRAVPAERFSTAGKELLSVDPEELLGKRSPTGRNLRKHVLPAFEDARKKVDQQAANAAVFGQQELQEDLVAFADRAIADTEKGAKRLAKGQSFHYSLNKRATALVKRLKAFDAALSAEVTAQIRSVVGQRR